MEQAVNGVVIDLETRNHRERVTKQKLEHCLNNKLTTAFFPDNKQINYLKQRKN